MSEETINRLVDEMTLAEQVSILSGEDFWSVPAVPRLKIGKLRVTDGPNGARGGGSLIGGVKAAAFPAGIALGATWDVHLVEEIGRALAGEVKSKSAHVLLAPTVNIHRSVTNGRNFECYSEDPVLTAQLAKAYITGLQSEGISATVKHFAGNESEIQRTTMSSEIDERSLREVYLVPSEVAVKEAKSWGVMSSYNRLNGIYTSENRWLLTEVLRENWGYDGIVMSDWFGSHSTAPTVNAGLDLEMPGPARDRGEKLTAAVEAGEVSRETVRERALNMLRLMDRTGALTDYRAFREEAEDRPETRALIRRAGAAAAVLLKNEGDILPLDATGAGKIAVIGPNAKTAQIMGGGSAQLNAHYRVSPFDGLANALGGTDRLAYAPGCTNHRFEPTVQGPFKVEFFDGPDLGGPVVHTDRQENAEAFWAGEIAGGKVDPRDYSARLTGTFVPEADGTHRVGAYAAGFVRVYVDGALVADAWANWQPGPTFFEEGCDEVVGTVELKKGKAHRITIEFAPKPSRVLTFNAFHVGIGRPLGEADIAAAADAAGGAELALVFIGRNGQWDTEGFDLPGIELPGLQNRLVAAVAAANPQTVVVLQSGGPVEMPWLDAVAAVVEAWYPGQEAGNAIADVLFGEAEPSGRLPQTFPVRWADNPAHSQDPEVYPGLEGKVRYEEGVFVGYRHYDRTGVEPLFPFGFGLGYTRFEMSGFAVDDSGFAADGIVRVHVGVRNTGKRTGTALVQVYVRDPEASVARPEKELKAFARVELAANDGRTVTLELDRRAFAFYDLDAGKWRIEAGRFEILGGFSAGEIVASGDITVDEDMLLPR